MRILIAALTLSALASLPVLAVEPPRPASEADAATTAILSLRGEVAGVRKEVAELRKSLAVQAGGEAAPPWGASGFAEIDRRIERLAQYQERIAAGIETPAPSLDEPIVLFTVALCTAILGFLGGRIVGRRSSRNRRMRL